MATLILLVFLAGIVDVSFLGLLRLELLLDCGLIVLTMLGLASDKGGDGIFEFISNLMCKLDVEVGLLSVFCRSVSSEFRNSLDEGC